MQESTIDTTRLNLSKIGNQIGLTLTRLEVKKETNNDLQFEKNFRNSGPITKVHL